MDALMIKTVDGPMLYRDNPPGRLAAIKAVRDQIQHHGQEVFDLTEEECADLSDKIGSTPYVDLLPFLIREQYISRRELLEN